MICIIHKLICRVENNEYGKPNDNLNLIKSILESIRNDLQLVMILRQF